ncbi:MAG TPA: ABC transporter permease [Methylomirabilota bacterium]|nr:ABC transporter permease [Methylomirabilota bacterium]
MSASRLAWPLGVTAVMLMAWEMAVAALRVKTVVLPRPSAVAAVVLERWPLLLEHLWPTFYQILLGFVLSVAGGLVMAVLVVYSEPIRKGVLPLIVTSQIVPKVAIAPLLVVWFGTGDLSRLLLAFLIAFFPIVINTVVGLTSVDDDYIKMARAFMGTRWQIFAKIRLPHALPLIFGGMKISITLAVIGIVVAEFVAAQRGIGYLIVMANGLLDTPLMMAAIAVLSAMGLALYGLIVALERVVVYWHAPAETTAGGTP